MNSSEQPSGGRPSDAARVRSWGFGPSVVVILLGAVILLAGPFVVRQLEFAVQEVSVEAASSRLDDQNLLALMNQATQDLAAKVGPSVVHVSTRNSLREGGFRPTSFYTSSGSGWIYDDDGHIVTNAHVITSAEVIEVQLSSGEIRTARFIGADARSDIAVVKISPERLTPADRNSGLPRQGDNVFAFGSPFDFRFSMSSGIVSGLGRTAGIANLDFEDFIQVDAAVNPGNSGGPLSDISGRVIGMNTAIATGRGPNVGDGQFAGIGLAIPVRMIELVVDQLIESGEVAKGYLGIVMRDIEQLEQFQLRGMGELPEALQRFEGIGVAITGVQPGFPAAEADVRPGDVLVAVDGVPVATIDNVRAQIGMRKPGTVVALSLWRWSAAEQIGDTISVDVELGRLEPRDMYVNIVSILSRIGFTDVVTFTPSVALAREMEWMPGVLVTDSVPASGWLSQGIEQGSIIHHVGREAISSEEDFYARLQGLFASGNGGRTVELGIQTPAGAPARVFMTLP